ncbi:MAG: cation:proton antiporter [Rickettsiales bacterium]
MLDYLNLFFNNIFKSYQFGQHNMLPDILTILFFAILAVVIFRKIKLSPLIGYIAAGALIGPYGLNISGYNDVTKSLAEFGVVFLLFVIGLELTIDRLLAMRKMIFGLGSAHFFLTSLIFLLILTPFLSDFSLTIIIATGLTLSSTAIVLKILSESYQANTRTGKISISILLLQDLAVIPLFVLIPLLGADDVNIVNTVIIMIVKSLIALSIIIFVGRFLLRPILHVIAAQKYEDLFIATTLFLVLSSAWITNYMGLSLGFGAFIAGVMIAETEFQHKIKSTINPFKGLFLGFFFITEIGMHLDLTLIREEFVMIALLAIALIIVKTLITLAICTLYKNSLAISFNTALLLSQTGEFAFVLFEMARKQNIMSTENFQLISVVVGLSMAITPLLAIIGKKYEDKISLKKLQINHQDLLLTSNSVIIGGYGRVGNTIAKILEQEGIKYIAIDSDNNIVAKNRKKNIPIYYGNMASEDFLKTLSLENSPTLILTMSNKTALKNTIKLIKKNYSNIQLIIRALDMHHYKELVKLNAKQFIVPEIQETGLQMTRVALSLMGESDEHIKQTIQEYRIKEF